MINNRYKIVKKRGAGSTGDVYKVKDSKDKRIIALKILYPDRPVQRFKREFRLLAGLHHPNLCTVYDFGVLDDGRSYFTMEYVDGEDMFKAAKGVSYETMYAWIVQLCRVLEYIHSKGLIHYDIKPGNVLIHGVGDKSVVKLMDFGLTGEQRIKGGALIKGTFPYIAPEVIKGLAVDHRADLYSLGVLLYEIFTRRPFGEEKESFVTLLKQRIDRVSRLPSKIVGDMPQWLERLIVRLLEFEPATRFSRANKVIKEINKFSRLCFALETEETIEGYLLSSRFVGRDREMGLLTSLYEQARQGQGMVVLITGDAGIGKSRLLKEFKIFTQLKRSHSFIGYAYKNKTDPLEPFHGIFSELINYFSNRPKLFRSRKLKLALAVLFKIFPDLTDGHLGKNLPPLEPLGPQQERLRNFESLTELIEYCATNFGELVILLEDLHWADDLSIQFLDYLGRNVGGRNILICGTCRQEELKENRLLKKVINNLNNEGCFSHIELKPFTFKSLYSFLDSTVTHDSNSIELVRYLMKKTDGNPFFVEEMMRTLLRTRGVSIGDKMEIQDVKLISIPDTIEDIVLKRIKNLDRTSQKIIKFGAVLLKDFNYDLIKRLTRANDTELSKALWELKKRQILVEEDNRYRFYHATLHEAINKRMAYCEKRKLYYQSGKIIEIINKGNLYRVVEDLAYYFINAKSHKKGILYGLRAAKKSSERYAHEQAIRFYKGVLNLLDKRDLKRRFTLLQELARIERCFDYYDDAVKHYNKALSLRTGTVEQNARIHLGSASVYLRKGQYNEALRIYQKALRVLKKMRRGKFKSLLETYINVIVSSVYLQVGYYKRAQQFDLEIMEFLQGLKTIKAIKLLANLYNNLGSIELHKGMYGTTDYDKAICYYKEAYKYSKKFRAQEKIATVLSNIGICYYYKYCYQKSLDYYQKAIQVSTKIGDQFGVSIKLLNLGIVLRDRGYYSRALDCFQKGLSISKKIGNPSMMGGSLLGLGACFLDLCDYGKAKECFMRALEIFDTIGWKGEQGFLMRGIGSVHKAMGDYTLAQTHYRKALKLFRGIGNQRKIASVLVKLSSVFIEKGEVSKAKIYAMDALKIVTGKGLREEEIECCIVLCQINIIIQNYVAAIDYYKKGIQIAKKIGMRRTILRLFVLLSEIYYREKKYSKSIKWVTKAIKMAKEMDTKDLYAEALLIKTKNEIEEDSIIYTEVIRILDEVKMIAAEIGTPELLWKVYFVYGKYFHSMKQYRKASEFYQKCIDVFKSVICKFKNEAQREIYLDRPDRQAGIAAMNKI